MEHNFLLSTFPVLLPHLKECSFSSDQFHQHIESLVASQYAERNRASESENEKDSTSSLFRTKNSDEKKSTFIDALLSDKPAVSSIEGEMLTANGDVAFEDSGEVLIDLFHELEDEISGSRLEHLLHQCWSKDPDSTLKVIWNARSIHLGKSSKTTFYRAISWLFANHPLTLLRNLPWLVRPVILKEGKTKDKDADDTARMVAAIDVDDDSDFEVIDNVCASKKGTLDIVECHADHDVKDGVSHGYWKDLLNILSLAAVDKLDVEKQVEIMSSRRHKKHHKPLSRYREDAMTRKRLIAARHDKVLAKIEHDPLYRALHASVARLFADQLRVDLARLKSGEKSQLKRITLAAKWAPSNKGTHDCHSFVSSTIAELLHPFDSVVPQVVDLQDRSLCLKYARAAYQTQTLAPLRRHLDIVERHITSKQYDQIKYERIPSLAMSRYKTLFAAKDCEHFEQYLADVVLGRANISGATLIPSRLVAEAVHNMGKVQATVLDLQWKSLVQRIKDSGTMESAIAVCDVSGSMFSPRFRDNTTPLHSAVGLSLLVAEVCKPPFGGHFITFSEDPSLLQVGGEHDTRTFSQKVRDMSHASWGNGTDFDAVFMRCILARAKQHNVKQEDMVKRIFVFSDMHFDAAGGRSWSRSYKRIKTAFKKCQYEMPELVFWNLSGGKIGEVAPKSVQAHETGTSLVSGYSQAMLKVFLDRGCFEVDKEDEDDMVVLNIDGDETKPTGMTPMMVLRKAIDHDAYRMLKVYD